MNFRNLNRDITNNFSTQNNINGNDSYTDVDVIKMLLVPISQMPVNSMETVVRFDGTLLL